MTVLVFRDDAYARGCAARVIATDERGIRLDRTVFYPTGGGQPGDTGSLRLASGETIAIVDAVKGDAADEVIHVPAQGTPLPSPGTELTAEIDWERRYRLMRMHSCLHLLCAVVPHPRLRERVFVLEPLAEVAPQWRHPLTGKTAQEMLADLRLFPPSPSTTRP